LLSQRREKGGEEKGQKEKEKEQEKAQEVMLKPPVLRLRWRLRV